MRSSQSTSTARPGIPRISHRLLLTPPALMGIPSDDVVQIRHADAAGEPTVVTVSCPDKTGLGCDLCRVVLLFGLSVVKGDMSTDGRWCYIVLWVLPRGGRPVPVPWDLLKDRLLQLCPVAPPFGFDNAYLVAAGLQDVPPPAPQLFLLKLCCFDRMGLLHGNTSTPSPPIALFYAKC